MIRRSLTFLLVLFTLLGVASGAWAQTEKKPKKAAAAAAHKEAPPEETAAAAPPPADPNAKEAAKDKAAGGAEDAEDNAHHHAMRTMSFAIAVTKLTKFEMGPGTYNAEFLLFVGCEFEGPCKPEPSLENGRIQGKPDKELDLPNLKVFKIKADFDAVVDLAEFPFDKHTLPIILSDRDENVQYQYDAKALAEVELPVMSPDVKLPGWVVDTSLKHQLVKQKLPGGGEAQSHVFAIEIKRPMVASFFKTLVPVFFMVFVAGFTLLLKPKSAAGRLTAATGGLMTVVMFHLSASSSLPPLGYLTRMDKFMIATYVVYLLNILFAVAIVRFDEKKNEKMAELAYLAAGGAVPGLALVAWLTVFLRVV